jgi:hypothetical protein
MVVEPDAAGARAALEFRLAEAGLRLAHVHHLAVHRQDGINVVKIGSFMSQKARVGQRAGGGEAFGLAADEVGGVAVKFRAHDAVGVHHRPKA